MKQHIVLLLVVLVMIIPSAFAVDFRDSIGYAPSWAKPLGPYETLARCSGIIGESTKDGNWCFEWVAYVLDQGGPSSIQSSQLQNENIERKCVKNFICAFPEEFLKYLRTSQEDDSSETSFVYFRDFVVEDKISVDIDGFGMKPLTWILDTRNGLLSNDDYEIDDKPFDLMEPLPIEQTLESKVDFSKYKITYGNDNILNNKQRTIIVATVDNDIEFLEKRYDIDTGILISSVEEYEWDGKRYQDKLKLIDTNILDNPTIIDSRQIIQTQTSQDEELESIQKEQESTESEASGCLIATAAYGSEMAPQVQLLREIRDNILLKTSSGASFMAGFNSIYYSFSPTVATWERQNPVFKEAVKITITPLITTLSILNYVSIDSEAEMLEYGIGVILLNIGMYFVAPAFVIIRLKQH